MAEKAAYLARKESFFLAFWLRIWYAGIWKVDNEGNGWKDKLG